MNTETQCSETYAHGVHRCVLAAGHEGRCFLDFELAVARERFALLDRLRTIVDEEFGPLPVVSDIEALTTLENGLFAARTRRLETLDALDRQTLLRRQAEEQCERVRGWWIDAERQAAEIRRAPAVPESVLDDITPFPSCPPLGSGWELQR